MAQGSIANSPKEGTIKEPRTGPQDLREILFNFGPVKDETSECNFGIILILLAFTCVKKALDFFPRIKSKRVCASSRIVKNSGKRFL